MISELIKKMPDVKSDGDHLLPEERHQTEGGLRTHGVFKNSEPGKPLVTVVTVVFNGVQDLEETILSIIHQDYGNVEYLIIDGISTDGTLDIIRKYQHAIDYWISEKDDGIYDAMNKGIDLATGDWINFMNAGDSFYSDTVLNAADFPSRTSGVIYGSTNMIYSPSLSKIVDPVSVDFKRNMPFVHQSSFVRTHLMQIYKFKSNEFQLIADKNFFLTIAKQNERFEKINAIIANSDVYGISNKFSLRMEKEQIIVGTRFSRTYIISYISNIPVRAMKLAIKHILPLRVVNKIRSKIGLSR